RRPRMAVPGRSLGSGLVSSQRGLPTAPKRIASARLQSWIVSGRSDDPWASIEAPPTRSSVTSSGMRWLCATRCSTATAPAMTSGPMPSPGSTTRFMRPGSGRLTAERDAGERPGDEEEPGIEVEGDVLPEVGHQLVWAVEMLPQAPQHPESDG